MKKYCDMCEVEIGYGDMCGKCKAEDRQSDMAVGDKGK